MINSHLLYRLSYRGTELRYNSEDCVRFGLFSFFAFALSLLRPAIPVSYTHLTLPTSDLV